MTKRIVGATVLVVLAAAAAALTLLPGSGNQLTRAEAHAQWISGAGGPNGIAHRRYVVAQAIGDGLLHGLSKAAVEAVIGPPTFDKKTSAGENLQYNLGLTSDRRGPQNYHVCSLVLLIYMTSGRLARADPGGLCTVSGEP